MNEIDLTNEWDLVDREIFLRKVLLLNESNMIVMRGIVK